MNARRLSGVFGVLLPTLLGCGVRPMVKYFEVRPRAICAGSPVVLWWKTTAGAVFIDAAPPVAPALDSVGSHGRESRRLEQTTAFTLSVRSRDAVASWSATAEVIPKMGRSYWLQAHPHCDAGQPFWKVVAPSRDWDGRLLVGQVRNVNKVALQVTHHDSAVLMAAGQSSQAFSGQPILGTWKIQPMSREPRWAHVCDGAKLRNPTSSNAMLPLFGVQLDVTCAAPGP